LVSGNYQAIVRTNVFGNLPETNLTNNTGTSAGTISAQLPELTLGSPVTGQLSTDGFAYYQFNVGANQTVELSLASDTGGTANDIYVSHGTIPTIGQFDATSTVPATQDPTAIIQQSQPGTYYVMVRESAGGAENYTLTASTIDCSISDVTPDQGSNVGTATLTISGAKFTGAEPVEIIAADGTTRLASSVKYVNSGEFWATFDLRRHPKTTASDRCSR